MQCQWEWLLYIFILLVSPVLPCKFYAAMTQLTILKCTVLHDLKNTMPVRWMAKVQLFEGLALPTCGHLCITLLWLALLQPSLQPFEGQQDVCETLKPEGRAQSSILRGTDLSGAAREPAQTAHTGCVHMIYSLLWGHILPCSSLHLLYFFIIALRAICTDGTAEKLHLKQTWHYLTCENKHTGICFYMYAHSSSI